METILENIMGVIEAVWFKLTTLLNLEEMGTLDSLQPILANILSDPLLLGLTLAVITIIPYTIYKVKNAYAEKEKRLDALLRELDDEENSEEADTSKPLFQNQNTKDYSLEEQAKESDSKTYGDEFESPSSEKTTVPSGDRNQTPQEIFKNRRISDDDFGWETSVEEWSELYDYISKPFQEDELVARIHSLLRRLNKQDGDYELDEFEVFASQREIHLDGYNLDLTNMEFELLNLFLGQPGILFSRDDILKNLKGIEVKIFSRSIDILISRLRQKIETDPHDPKNI
jgi:hypothetical protein